LNGGLKRLFIATDHLGGVFATHAVLTAEVGMHNARIALVDEAAVFRQGLAWALRGSPKTKVVAEASDGREALELFRRGRIDAAVVELILPSVSGLSITAELHHERPACRVLVLSTIDEPGIIADVLRAGACGYALKQQPVVEVVEALEVVLAGARYLPPSIPTARIEAELAGPESALTRRERDVFELLIRGHGISAVANRLAISLRTAETHRQRILNKLSHRAIPLFQLFGRRR
jgi:two-component system response regulator NreC